MLLTDSEVKLEEFILENSIIIVKGEYEYQCILGIKKEKGTFNIKLSQTLDPVAVMINLLLPRIIKWPNLMQGKINQYRVILLFGSYVPNTEKLLSESKEVISRSLMNHSEQFLILLLENIEIFSG